MSPGNWCRTRIPQDVDCQCVNYVGCVPIGVYCAAPVVE